MNKNTKLSKDSRYIISEGQQWKIKSHIVEAPMTRFNMVGKGSSDSEYVVYRGSYSGYKKKQTDGFKADYAHHKVFGVQETHNGRSEIVKHRITRNFQVEEMKNGKFKNAIEDNEIGAVSEPNEAFAKASNFIQGLIAKGLTASKLILWTSIAILVLVCIWILSILLRK